MTRPSDTHFELIQGVIGRLANNSLTCKSWAVTLVAAAAALTAKDALWYFSLAGAIPPIMFWYLDAFYLQRERTFRTLYERLVKDPASIAPMSLDISGLLDTHKMRGILFSANLALFYMPLILVSIVLGLLKRSA